MAGPYDLDLSKASVAVGNVDVSTLNVNGAPVAGGAASVTTLAASGAATLSSTLAVTGASTLHALTATTFAASGAVTCATTLGVTGASTLAGLSCTTLAASGAAALASTLTIVGALSGASGGPLLLGVTTFTFSSDANKVLSAAQMANPLLVVNGAVISTTRNIQVPNTAGAFLIVDNQEAHPVQIIGAAGSGVTVANAKHAILYADGTNWNRLTADA